MADPETKEEPEINIPALIEKERDTIFSIPRYLDVQDAFDAMETNYFRLKQESSHNPKQLKEIEKDWYKYAEALRLIKYGRIVLDLDKSAGKIDDLFENFNKMSKEAFIVKDVIEKKFQSLLLEHYLKIPNLVVSR